MHLGYVKNRKGIFECGILHRQFLGGNHHEFNKKNKGVPVAAVHYEKLDEYIILRDGQEQPLYIDDPKKFIRSIRRLNKDCEIINKL